MSLDQLTAEDIARIKDIFAIVMLLQHILVSMGLYRIFLKAGINEWLAFIPVVNIFFILKIACGSGAYILFKLIPCIGSLIIGIYLGIKLSPAFGKGVGMILLIIFLYPLAFLMLGFGSAQYHGPQ